MNVCERFLKYVSFSTQSDEESASCPSTEGQLMFGKYLMQELKEIGAWEVSMDEHGYVYGKIPATKGMENQPKLGLIAHMDTAPSFCGHGVKPKVINNYDGTDIPLDSEGREVLRVCEYEELKQYIGQSLIVTDGTTLLGSDDKAGIAEIMTAAERLLRDEIAHGPVSIAFTPDEEIGRGADYFDVEKFGADYAYTVDGGALGEIEYENFNAASALIRIHGVNIHPGEAKNKMKNASLIAMELNGMLPPAQIPACTEGYEGFYHLCIGNCETGLQT